MNESALTKVPNSKVQNSQQFLVEAYQKLMPWWSFNDKDILKVQTEQDPKSYLDSYYLFPLNEISVNADCDDIPQFINERFQNILAAASHSGLSVALVLSSKKGNSDVFLGFKNESTTNNSPELFESIVNGILPGKRIKLDETITISSLVDGYRHGGMVTGVPTLKKDEDKQKFNLSSVARSLYGREYLLAIISRPVSEIEKQKSFIELIQLRDNLHTLVRQTVGEEKGTGSTSTTTSFSTTKGESKTSGYSIGWGIMFIGLGGMVSGGIASGFSKSETAGESKGISEQQSRSVTVEQQNGFACELEKIAGQYIERMKQGFCSGYWETSITFATQDKIGSDVLAGTFAGELSKPSDKLLPPPRI